MRDMITGLFQKYCRTEEFNGKRILEVGSLNINGSIRPLIEGMKPKEYIGVDVQEGKGVDLVLAAENIMEHFGASSFNIVISTETLEHVLDWRVAINNMKGVLKPLGFIFITVPPFIYQYHACPNDNWRYTSNDVAKIFDDFEIWELNYSIFFKGRKPQNYIPIDLSNISIYSMFYRKKTLNIPTEKESIDDRKKSHSRLSYQWF